jgi:hypothetical protein
MRKFSAVFIGTLFVYELAAQVFAATETVTGRVIDLACYGQDKANTENAHKGKGMVCAQACAKEGFAVGLLTTEGKVYRVAGGLAADNNARLVPHMAHTVTITGDVSEKDGNMVIVGNDLKTINK